MTILAGVLWSRVVGQCSTVVVGVASSYDGLPCWLEPCVAQSSCKCCQLILFTVVIAIN